MAKNEQVRIDLVAQDKASDTIDDVADAAKKLERLEPEIEITADADKAERAVEDLSDDARALSRQDAEIVLTAKVAAAKSALADLRSDMEKTGDEAKETQRELDDVTGKAGPSNLRGNAIADLTGPLGEASGAASDFAGVFDGLGDLAEEAANKIGLSAGAAQNLSGMIGGLGVAVAAGAALWSFYSQQQQKAREKQKQLMEGQQEINQALREGDIEQAARTFIDAYGDIADEARKSGLFVDEFTRFVTGQQDALPEWEANIADVRAGLEEGSVEMAVFNGTVEDSQRAVQQARQDYIDANGALREQDQAVQDVSGALQRYAGDSRAGTEATDALGVAAQGAADDVDYLGDRYDVLRGKLNFEQAVLNFQTSFGEAHAKANEGVALTAQEILDLKNDYLTVAEELKLHPLQIESDLKKIEQGDANAVFWDTQAKVNQRGAVTMDVRLRFPNINIPPNVITGSTTMGYAAPSVVNVTQNIPRGWRGDVLAEAQSAARRSGGLYRRARR